jgi:hypothetical protein
MSTTYISKELRHLVPKLRLGTQSFKLRLKFAFGKLEAELPIRRAQAELGGEARRALSCKRQKVALASNPPPRI